MRRLLQFLFVLVVLLVVGSGRITAQQFMGVKTNNRVICYAHTADNPCYIPPPEAFLSLKNGARKKTSTIEVIYNSGFTPEAEAAFNYALEIWESLIVSPVPIRIDAYWTSLGPTTLGSALYTSAYTNFRNAPKLNVFYPVALAEKIIGRELNGTEPDLFIQFNSNINWHFNPNTPPGAGQFDLVSVVLHEIAHGLGFAGTFTSNGTTGRVGLQSTTLPIIYDIPIENGNGANLIRLNQSPSITLHNELTGGNLFFNSATSSVPKLFAPSTFDGGSSISHLDEQTFNNTSSSLMTPQIAPAEKIHNPGLAWNMLQDMGWEFVRIVHQPLPDRENVSDPFVVTAQIEDDNGFNSSSVTLFYSTDGGSSFTGVNMTATGNPKEFSGSIPARGTPQEYGYYITVRDNANREFTNPGKFVRINNTEIQNLFFFETGPDFTAPIIRHSPKLFLLDSETSLDLEARVTDNISIASVTVEYAINGNVQPQQPLTLNAPGEDSVYTVSLNTGALTNGDVITYRIIAIDNSSNSNQSISPSSDVYTVNVVGLEPTQDKYVNDFNSSSTDFFGNGFSITQPSGFADPAIHTTHPYPEGTGFPGDSLNFIYQLKIPIRVKEKEATIRFDEIVLVEPGEPGTVFGDDEFWDYVVVEGSIDGGITWIPIADGYDSRANTDWLNLYTNSIVDNNSTASGNSSLFRPRTLNLQDVFDTDDEVVIRFRLFSDPLARGWGWAIDNLKIQFDDIPPAVLHDHIDYLNAGDEVSIVTKVSDASGIESLTIEYRINSNDITVVEFSVNPPAESYTFTLTGLSALDAGDLLEYRIIATDSAGNQGIFPPVGEFIKVPIVSFTAPVTTYANSFNAPSTDFVGNFFTISQPVGFTDGAIHSAHFYPNGQGLDKTSSFNFTLLKPITISSTNPFIRYDEIVIIEGHSAGVSFGSPNFKDYVIVEGSKDGGITWTQFLNGYDLVGGESSWNTAFTAGDNGNASMFRRRAFDLTANSSFQAGDEVLIRFRLFSNETINGWGWAIDNLYIQDPITSAEQVYYDNLKIYPNPVSYDQLTIERENTTVTQKVEMLTLQGQKIYSALLIPVDGMIFHQIDVSAIPQGMYLIILQSEGGEKIIQKIIKTN